MIRFVPTLTGLNFSRYELDEYDEVLITSKNSKYILPEHYEGDIIIDNGGYSINHWNKPKENIYKHLEICKKIKHDSRCIFILPDIQKDTQFSIKMQELFLKEINPQRYSLVDFDTYIDRTDNKIVDDSYFYCINKNNILKRKFNKEQYHVFGYFNDNDFRSFDTTKIKPKWKK